MANKIFDDLCDIEKFLEGKVAITVETANGYFTKSYLLEKNS